MKGIIFVVWEKYLAERFGNALLDVYHEKMGGAKTDFPVTNHTSSDRVFFAGLHVASELTLESEDRLLFEYGRYFMQDRLVEHLCSYMFAKAHCGNDLLMLMINAYVPKRLQESAQPLFSHKVLSPDNKHILITYNCSHNLCSLLEGAIHGAAERYGERAYIHELSCKKNGAPACCIEVQFKSASLLASAKRKQQQQIPFKQGLTDLILRALSHGGEKAMNLYEIKAAIEKQLGPYFQQYQRQFGAIHISQIYTGLVRLYQAGLVTSMIDGEKDTFESRRYQRALAGIWSS